jgi:hypothetical protein
MKAKKRQYRIVLSDAAYKLLLEKSKHSKESIHDVAEAMIMEFSRSTSEEVKLVSKQADSMMHDFIMSHLGITNPPGDILSHKRAWRDGYLTGWKLFQLRKKKSMFKKYRKDLFSA